MAVTACIQKISAIQFSTNSLRENKFWLGTFRFPEPVSRMITTSPLGYGVKRGGSSPPPPVAGARLPSCHVYVEVFHTPPGSYPTGAFKLEFFVLRIYSTTPVEENESETLRFVSRSSSTAVRAARNAARAGRMEPPVVFPFYWKIPPPNNNQSPKRRKTIR